MNDHRGRVASVVLLLVVCLVSVPSSARAQTPVITDQVLITVLRDRIFAATPGEGLIRADLLAGEEIMRIESKGLNALVQTSVRLLGFSSQVVRWNEVRTDLGEKVQDSRVTQSYLFVRTNRHLYGFQGPLGLWKTVDLGVREEIGNTLVAENVVVVVTDRRALAFSAITGGFFQQDLSINDPVVSSAINANVVILSTGTRRWIFRSQLAVWAELR